MSDQIDLARTPTVFNYQFIQSSPVSSMELYNESNNTVKNVTWFDLDTAGNQV